MTNDQKRPAAEASPAERRRAWMLAGTVSLLMIAGAAAWHPGLAPPPPVTNGMTSNAQSVSLTPQAAAWKFLKIAEVRTGGDHWTDDYPAHVAVDPSRTSRLGAPLSGRVVQVFVELGESVREGQSLFTVSSGDVADLQATREKSRLDQALATKNLDRIRATVDLRALAQKELVSAEQQERQAELAFRLADSKLASLRISTKDDHEYIVTSPRNGVVVEKNISRDQQVDATGGALVSVADLSSVWVVADLFESQTLDVRPGAVARVTTPSAPDLALEGRVEQVSAVADPERHTIPIRIRLANSSGHLRPNVFARVRFRLASSGAELVVGSSAIVSDGEKQYVYVEEGTGHFVRRPVIVGATHENHTAILSGLKQGQRVVEEGAILLDNQLSVNEQPL